jgi:hypothetical protein
MVKKVVSIADANRVLRMVREGRAVPVSSLRTALLLVDDSRKTTMAKNRALQRNIVTLNGFLDRAMRQ